ncbi:hypothetical protein [Thiocapsa marina]|uniref:Lipoprotein n=1 Tax=Thiocapsa marina 5811 TaxID=768671 RepID=F9UH07_9GAMM|nr:hypothetical protein [Thiocapsa marina]EGV16505.1 hypothetical protein ThimaDRAFT_4274 [Thiocapsa marina 5811]
MTLRTLVRSTAFGLLAVLLGGCETLVRQSADSGWVGIPPGSALTLNRPVQVQPGRARVFLVDRGSAASRESGTSCVLEVRRIDAEAIQTIPAGTVEITRVQDYIALVSSRVPTPTLDRGVRFQLAGHGDSGGSQMIRPGYHFWLDDSQDPNLMRMTCLGRLDDPAYTRAPTLAEIQAVLGDVATLEVALPAVP